MNELYSQITLYANKLWRRRWYALATTWVVCLIGWVVVAMLPNVYQSSGRIYIDTASVLNRVLTGVAVQTDPRAQIRLLQQTLLSRPNLQRAVRMVDLDLTAETPSEMETLISSVRERTTLSSTVDPNDRRAGQQDLFSISFTAEDPKRARDLVQALITIFVEGNLTGGRGDLASARDFLKEKVDLYGAQLQVAEQRLSQHKLQYADLLPGNTTFLTQAQGARVQLAQTQVLLSETRTKRNVLRNELSTIPELLELGSNDGAGPPNDTAVKILEIEYLIEEMLARYTEQHPDVITARRHLAALLEQEEEAFEGLPADGGAGPLQDEDGPPAYGIPNPVYTNLHAQLVQREAEVQILEERLTRLAAVTEKLSEKASKVPEVEVELNRLSRNYESIKVKYDQFASRLGAVQLGQQKNATGDTVEFKIVDPPKVPAFPSGPDRPLFLTVVLFIGIASGLALAVVLVVLDDTFTTASTLKEQFGLPVLGTVSSLQSVTSRMWGLSRMTTTAVAIIGIFATYGFLQIVEQSSGLNNSGLSVFSPGFINRTLNLVQQTLAGLLSSLSI